MTKYLFSLLLASSCAFAAPRGQEQYEKRIRPILQKYCYDCHSDDVTKGDFALDEFSDYSTMIADKVHWDHVRQQVATHVMPPEKKAKPSLAERDEVIAWLDDSVFWFDPERPDPGPANWRRLNRTEYDHTIRDLLLVDLRPSSDFPPDDTGYGYDNIADVLSISPILMEKYIRAATNVADKALDTSISERLELEVQARKFWNHKGSTTEASGLRWFHSEAEAATKFTAPATGDYQLQLRVSATQAGPDAARIALLLDGKELAQFDVTARFRDEKGPWQTIKHNLTLSKGEHRASIRFLNDFSDPQNPDPAKRDRNLALQSLQIDGPYGLLPPSGTRLLQWLVAGKPVGHPELKLSGEDFLPGEGQSNRDTGAISLPSAGSVIHRIDIAKAGKYRITVKAGAQQAGNEPAKFDVRIAGKNAGSFAITAKEQAPQWFHAEADLPVGKHEIQVWFLNDFYDPKTHQDRNFWLHQLSVSGPINEPAGLTTAEMPLLVEKLGTRLFRRPLTTAEKEKWTTLASLAAKEGESPLDSLALVLRGMLVSPSFLFRAPPQPIGAVEHDTALIDESSLATRLSYFLWSAPPDEKLLQLASSGQLRKNLRTEIQRMLGDWRAESLATDFAGQWLQLRDMNIVAPDTRRFPEFKYSLSSLMKKESEMLFSHILQQNLPVVEFLQADYSFLNEKLARFYEIKGVKGDKMQKTSLAGTPRGGILTHGSILTLTSNPTRTSPVKRGKYLLENILGTPPPPAPGGVPPLDEKKARFGNLTLRQQFAEHRSNASCAGCHAFLDPLGFAFENYDAIGRWRTEEKKQPIDASGALVRGQTFKDLAELRSILVRDMSGHFTRNLVENLLTYSLGRGLEFSDRPTVAAILKKTAEKGHRFQDLIIAVCESAPFQRMRVQKP
ncbi:MAG: DUF1592 domain-containing protein [Verrucomicrobiaceae bacterium]|nr:DUF1592 domain-containing protein [Verrucomicrobiaceae bacterium]